MRAFVRPWRAGVLVAVPALAVLGLAGMPSLAGAATGQQPPAPAVAVTPGASAPVAPRFLSPLPTPALPAGIAQGCNTPAQAGQMQCDVLVNTKARPRAAVVPNAIPANAGYTPTQLQAAYGLASAAAAANTGTVAIVDAFNDPKALADLTKYRSDAGLPACTVASGCLKIVNQAGGTTPLPGTDPTGGWEVEESLDLDMVSAICPHCKILLVEAKSANITDLAPAENYAASHAKFVSNSWGSGGEFIGENSLDSVFNHPGVVITAASGDFGYGAQYPASSQLVTSVGGTSLTQPSPTTWAQTAWSGAGSGCSTLEPKPAWQTDTNATTGCLNRTENDVSAVADPNTGVAVYDTFPNTIGVPSGYNPIGGTSASTPIIASVYALAGTARAGTYTSSYPYQHTSALSQVTSGSNGTCEPSRLYLCDAAGSLTGGYNGPTGLGTPSGIGGFSEATTGDVVTVLNPGTVDIADGVKLTLPIHAVDSVSTQKLTYSATGLPAGLAISTTTGAITGTDTGPAGTASVTVTATDATAASGSVTFNLATVASMRASYHAAAGTVRLALAGKCLDDTNGSTANGNKIQIYTCSGNASQTWAYVPNGNPGGAGTLTIHGKCLDIVHAGTANGSKVDLWTCTGGANEQWFLDGFGVLVNPVSGRCLDDTGKSTKNGTQVDIYACVGTTNQSWTLTASPVQSGVPGKCVDDTGNSTAIGNKIQISACNGGASQKWVLAADGTLRINGRCLDVAGQSLLDGALIQLSACASGQPSQLWLVGPNGELINANSGRCLDDPGATTVDGTQLDQQDCYGNVSEVWAAT